MSDDTQQQGTIRRVENRPGVTLTWVNPTRTHAEAQAARDRALTAAGNAGRRLAMFFVTPTRGNDEQAQG